MKINFLIVSFLIISALNVSAQITNPNLKDVTVNTPDLTIMGISRVAGKNELNITVANNGKITATKAKLRIYALPYGFCASMEAYDAPGTQAKIDNPNNPCLSKPFEIPNGQRITSAEYAKSVLALAWTSAAPNAFDIAAGASHEQAAKFSAQPILAAGETPKKVFPIPFVKFNNAHIFAPWSILNFDLSVFYAVVETEGELNKTNNDYFFNIRRRAGK